jgi:hypothetical protein
MATRSYNGLMLWVLYLDETGHEKDRTKLHIGIAGLLAPAESLETFGPRWIAALEQFGVKEPFHMMDFASRRRSYKNWPEKRRRELLGALVELIVAIPHVKLLGVVVCMQALLEMPEPERLRLGSPYFVALENCIRNSVFDSIAEAKANVFPPKIQIVLAKNVGYSGRGAELWDEMREVDALGVTGMFMDSIKIGTPGELPELQAADLIAYESGKFFNHTVPHEKELRWAYKRMSCLQNSSFRHFGKQELHSSLQRSGVTAEGLSYFYL